MYEDLEINHTFSFDEDLDFLRDEVEIQKNLLQEEKFQREMNSKTIKQLKSILSKRRPLRLLNTKLFSRT